MRNKNIIMLLISSLILSGCGPEPEDKKSQQQQSTTSTDQQSRAAIRWKYPQIELAGGVTDISQ